MNGTKLTKAKLFNYARSIDGYRHFVPSRIEVMEATGAICRCGDCACCQMRRFTLRVRVIDSKRED